MHQVRTRFYTALKKKYYLNPSVNIPKNISIEKEAEQETEAEEEKVNSDNIEEQELKAKEEPAKTCTIQKMERYNAPQEIIRGQNSYFQLESALISEKGKAFPDSLTPSSGTCDSIEIYSEQFQADDMNFLLLLAQIEQEYKDGDEEDKVALEDSEERELKVKEESMKASIWQKIEEYNASQEIARFKKNLEEKLIRPVSPFIGDSDIENQNLMEEPDLELQRAIMERKIQQRFDILTRKKNAAELYYKSLLQELSKVERMALELLK